MIDPSSINEYTKKPQPSTVCNYLHSDFGPRQWYYDRFIPRSCSFCFNSNLVYIFKIISSSHSSIPSFDSLPYWICSFRPSTVTFRPRGKLYSKLRWRAGGVISLKTGNAAVDCILESNQIPNTYCFMTIFARQITEWDPHLLYRAMATERYNTPEILAFCFAISF